MTFDPAGPPGAPESLYVRVVGRDGLSVEWKPPSQDGGAKIRQYHLERQVEGAWKPLTSLDSYKTSHVLSGLTPDQDYVIAVSAENQAGVGERCQAAKPVRISKPISELPPLATSGRHDGSRYAVAVATLWFSVSCCGR